MCMKVAISNPSKRSFLFQFSEEGRDIFSLFLPLLKVVYKSRYQNSKIQKFKGEIGEHLVQTIIFYFPMFYEMG
jgi:hypothetical protein